MSEAKVMTQPEVVAAQQEYENKQRFQKETVEKIEQSIKEREEQREKKKKEEDEKEKTEREKLSLWQRLMCLLSEEMATKYKQEMQEVSLSYNVQAKEPKNELAKINMETINEELRKKQGYSR